jgi:ABC-type Fe3+ transport system permease subunit
MMAAQQKKQHRQAQQKKRGGQARQGSSSREQPSQQLGARKKQGTLRKVFTVVICVVVALGLSLPIAGIGVYSCSTAPEQQPLEP